MEPPRQDESPDGEDEFDFSLGHGLAGYLRTRLQLLSIESQEAARHFGQKLIPVVVAITCAMVAYFLLVAMIVSLLGKALGAVTGSIYWGWEVIALIMALTHIFVLWRMKETLLKPPARPLFEFSRAEIERDRTWIKDNNPVKKS